MWLMQEEDHGGAVEIAVRHSIQSILVLLARMPHLAILDLGS